MKIDKKYFTLLLLVYIGIFWSFLQYGINHIFSCWDETLAILGGMVFLLHFRFLMKDKAFRAIFLATLIFATSGLLGNALFGYNKIINAISDLFINVKFFLCIILLIVLYRRNNILKFSDRISVHLNILSVFLIVVFFLDRIFHWFPVYEERFGLQSEQLFFQHPTFYASSIFYLLMLRILFVNKRDKINFFINSLLAVMICFSLRFKAIASVFLLVAIAIYMYRSHLRRYKSLIILLSVLTILLVSQNQLRFYFSGYGLRNFPRGVLLLTSLHILRDYFPIGTGFATFGSYVSGTHYSPVYDIYNISNIYGISRGNINAITDLYWPMIAGQSGIIGLICMIVIWIVLFNKIKKIRKINTRYYIAGLTSFCYLLCSSTSESSICNPACIPIAILLGLVFSQNFNGADHERKSNSIISSAVSSDGNK